CQSPAATSNTNCPLVLIQNLPFSAASKRSLLAHGAYFRPYRAHAPPNRPSIRIFGVPLCSSHRNFLRNQLLTESEKVSFVRACGSQASVLYEHELSQ